MLPAWELEKLEHSVKLHSFRRMPHSSIRSPMDEGRKALRREIESMSAGQNKIIEGIYTSEIDGFFDIENVVIYNLETATFRNAATQGLRARRERSFGNSSVQKYPHMLEYRLIDTPPVPETTNAHLRFSPSSVKSVFDVWWAASNGVAVNHRSVRNRFGLHVVLGGPITPSNPAGKMKIIFDGIIAALQKSSPPETEAIKRLHLKHQVDVKLIQEKFYNPISPVILQSRSTNLIRPYRTGVQWHPADDLCEECTLIVEKSAENICNAYIYDIT